MTNPPLAMDQYPPGHYLEIGDVIIRQSPHRAPSLFLVGPVTEENRLPSGNLRLLTGKSDALDYAYSLLGADCMVLWVDDDGTWFQDTSKRPG